jgi:hypothetical protein
VLTGLTKYVYAPIAALALWAVVLAVSPATANAQATHQTQGQQNIVVVAPGDSLWSISSEWLGPDATAQQIAVGVERIYALNRDRIGAHPNVLFVGQRLVLPSAVEQRSTEPASSASERGAAEPTAAPSTTSRAANDGSAKATRAALTDAHREPQQSVDARPGAAPLPEPARATPVPAVKTLSPRDPSPSLVESFAGEARSSFSSVVAAATEALPRGAGSWRKLLGGALMAMSAVLAVILALHVARILFGSRFDKRRAQKRWVREVRSRTNYASLPTYDTNSGLFGNGAAPSDSARDIPRRRQVVDTEFGELNANEEWEVGEPLRRAVENIPLEPRLAQIHALSEAKFLAEDELTTLAFLERRRHLSAKEHRQADALRRFLAALDEEEVESRAG